MQCKECDDDAVITFGKIWLCAKHYRFRQIRASAGHKGKTVPSKDQLEAMYKKDMSCQDCGVAMNLLGRDGQRTVLCLQHYRDGSYGFVCRSCNTRHGALPGDLYREIDRSSWFCRSCKTVKPKSEFGQDKTRNSEEKLKPRCKACYAVDFKKWVENNREKYNALQREKRARSKLKALNERKERV